MHIFFIKSLLSLIVFGSCLVAVYTAFELFGRSGHEAYREILRRVHRYNGIFFSLLCIGLAMVCLGFLARTGAEPSVRSMFHGLFSLGVLSILTFKMLVVWRYRQFYAKLQTAGLILVMMSFGMIGTSGGYYLLITKFGHGTIPAQTSGRPDSVFNVKTDPESVRLGRDLYEEKCMFCHDPLSNRVRTGPGHKAIMKNEFLPVSGKQSSPENIAVQLRTPYRDMPSFSYLTDDQVRSLIAYLNTL